MLTVTRVFVLSREIIPFFTGPKADGLLTVTDAHVILPEAVTVNGSSSIPAVATALNCKRLRLDITIEGVKSCDANVVLVPPNP
jgi:hypothetical protein